MQELHVASRAPDLAGPDALNIEGHLNVQVESNVEHRDFGGWHRRLGELRIVDTAEGLADGGEEGGSQSKFLVFIGADW